MRCPPCGRTGFTLDELQAHTKKTGHVLPADESEWNTRKEFPPKTGPKYSRDELLAALKDLGIVPAPPATSAPPPNGPKGGTG